MSQKRLHLWLPDRRSFCDQKSLAESVQVPADEWNSYPMCGACLLAIDVMTAETRALLLGGRAVDPADPEDAVAQLRGTRWVFQLNMDDLLEDVRQPGYRYAFVSTENEEN